MNKVITAIIALAIILSIGIIDTVFISKTFDELDYKLSDLKDSIEEENSEDSLKKIEQISSWWDNKKHKLEFFSFCQDLRLISSAIGETRGSIECEDFDNAMSKVESLLVISNTTRDLLGFRVENIF